MSSEQSPLKDVKLNSKINMILYFFFFALLVIWYIPVVVTSDYSCILYPDFGLDIQTSIIPIGIGLARVVNPMPFLRHLILHRPIGAPWWYRFGTRVVRWSPLLGGILTLGRLISFMSGASVIVTVALGLILIETGLMSLHEYVMTLIPLVPYLEPILEAIPTVISSSSSWTVWGVKKIILGVSFLLTAGFSKPLAFVAIVSRESYQFLYSYVVGMWNFIPLAWADTAIINIRVISPEGVIISNDDRVANFGLHLYQFSREFYLLHREIGVQIVNMAASHVIEGTDYLEMLEVTSNRKNTTFFLGTIVAFGLVTLASSVTGPTIEAIGYLFS